jgi:hypothetical protein
VGSFFTPLRLSAAFREYDASFHISRRKYIPPNFAELRHILNIAQVRVVCVACVCVCSACLCGVCVSLRGGAAAQPCVVLPVRSVRCTHSLPSTQPPPLHHTDSRVCRGAAADHI